jgi:hypothetical protein
VLEELDGVEGVDELDDESLELEVFSELDDDDEESDLTELFEASRLSVR